MGSTTLLQLLEVKSSLLQPKSWPFLFLSSPSHTGLCSHVVSVPSCRCLPSSLTHLAHIFCSWWPELWNVSHKMFSGIYFHSALQRQHLGSQVVLLPLLQEAEIWRCGEVANALRNGGTQEQRDHSCLLGAHLPLDGKFPLLWSIDSNASVKSKFVL